MTVYDERLSAYITDLFARTDPVLEQILAAIPVRGLPNITVSPEEGRFLQVLVRATGARRVVEIGTLGGYSGIWLARGLPPDGRVITVEKDAHHAAVAREHFALAGVDDRVEVREGEARDVLPGLAAEGPFDFCFIDADKTGYDQYLTWALENVRPGGLVAAHNAFRQGAILDPSRQTQDDQAIRAVNERFAREPRLLATIYPGGDGLLIGVVQV